VDWIVWHKKEGAESDSLGKTKSHWRLKVVLGILTGLAVLETLVVAWKESADSRPSGSPERGLVQQLTSVEGDTQQETTQLQTFLQGVLIEGLTAAEALNRVGSLTFAQRTNVRRKALERMLYRLESTKDKIGVWQDILRGCLPR
jgi:hypothetical protein